MQRKKSDTQIFIHFLYEENDVGFNNLTLFSCIQIYIYQRVYLYHALHVQEP